MDIKEIVRRSSAIEGWMSESELAWLVCGHDYAHEWPGVRRAVKETKLDFKVVDGTKIWYVNV